MRLRFFVITIVLVIVAVCISCTLFQPTKPPPMPETDSTPAPTPSEATPTPQPSPMLPPEIEKGLLILSHSSYVDKYGYFHLVGEVENLGKHNTEHNRVRVDFYDEQGTLYTTGSGECYREVIEPGEKSPFEVIFTKTPQVTNYKLTPEWDITERQLKKEMVFAEVKCTIEADGHCVLTGKIINEGKQTVENVMIISTFYDVSGKVVAAGLTFPETTPIKPDNSSTFTMVVEPALSSNIDNYALQAEVH